MPNPRNETDHMQQTPIAGTHGYVGVTATAPAPATLPYDVDGVIRVSGFGAPTDGTSGTFAGIAGKGSVYLDATNANMYINAGTKASPTWKLVTRAPWRVRSADRRRTRRRSTFDSRLSRPQTSG